ncbi:glucooligosaccharide oxidase [Marasmius fiardii PR-910]|nr:glucooligosaccharide oxidase [Marasmius fiardii PR-910]
MRLNLFTLLIAGAFSYAQTTDLITLQSQLAKDGITAVFPGDVGYPNATQAYNRRFTLEPVTVTFPRDTQQVSSIVKAGAARGLKVVARSGGHSYIANGLGGTNGSLVVDLSSFKRISFDPATNTAVIEPGNRLGEVATGLNEVGRGVPHGRCTWVGLGGHSGFGGWGHASRMWGLTLDNVLSATVVLANGTVVETSESQHPELFWAIRGSSASFGIVTSLTMQTHAVPSSGTFFQYIFDMDATNATHAFSSFQSFVTNPALPNTLGIEIGFLKGSARGRVSVMLFGSLYGPVEEYNSTLGPLLDVLPEPATATVVPGTWFEVLTAAADGEMNTTGEMPRDTFYAKSLTTPEDGTPLTEGAMGALITYASEEGFDADGFWAVEVEVYGGHSSAINAVPLDQTAFGHRNTLFTIQFYTESKGQVPPWDDAIFGFADGFPASLTDNMPSDWAWGAYTNYIDPRLNDWQHRYYGQHYGRLQALKKDVDPDNTFRFPTSIEE